MLKKYRYKLFIVIMTLHLFIINPISQQASTYDHTDVSVSIKAPSASSEESNDNKLPLPSDGQATISTTNNERFPQTNEITSQNMSLFGVLILLCSIVILLREKEVFDNE
ncbi:hypothetical protein [Vagococcus zengguangii]|uniref:Uncharacterized protein n=1 Tax=Vagococcus zengguangii TaxID=2571750 RepID=A0A4D7CU62_9ENTE|nr:hypothetical protein [Vagococcus zengguangii]QCI85881.1 hypothetical protein FA707_02380 [Vagococcus zengguangii]TLG81821.1 hypothetical protein FE258_01360 [Vagococcus zengguangii]